MYSKRYGFLDSVAMGRVCTDCQVGWSCDDWQSRTRQASHAHSGVASKGGLGAIKQLIRVLLLPDQMQPDERGTITLSSQTRRSRGCHKGLNYVSWTGMLVASRRSNRCRSRSADTDGIVLSDSDSVLHVCVRLDFCWLGCILSSAFTPSLLSLCLRLLLDLLLSVSPGPLLALSFFLLGG